MKRKVLSVITALGLLLSLCPVGALAAGEASVTVCGTTMQEGSLYPVTDGTLGEPTTEPPDGPYLEYSSGTLTVHGDVKLTGEETPAINSSGALRITGDDSDSLTLTSRSAPALVNSEDSDNSDWVTIRIGNIEISCKGSSPAVVGNVTIESAASVKFFGGSSNSAVEGNVKIQSAGDISLIFNGYPAVFGSMMIETASNVTVSGSGSAPAVTGGVEIQSAGDISLTSDDSYVVSGPLKIGTASNVTVSGSGSGSTPAVTGGVEIQSAGDISLTSDSYSVVQGNLKIGTASNVTVSGGGSSNTPAVRGGVEITSADSVTLTSTAMVVSGPLTIKEAGSVSVTGSGPAVTGAVDITSSGSVNLISSDSTAVGNSLTIRDAASVEVSGGGNGPAVTGDANITSEGDVTLTSGYIAVNGDLTVNSGGSVTISGGTESNVPTLTGTVSITAKDDISITDRYTSSNSIDYTTATLISQSGKIRVNDEVHTAQLNAGGKITTYPTIEAALAAAEGAADATITLLDDVTGTDYLNVAIPCTLDLNGHSIAIAPVGYGRCNLTVKSGGNLTVQDTSEGQTGRIEGVPCGISVASGATATLTGGTFSGTDYGADVSGSLNVSGNAALTGEAIGLRVIDNDNSQIVRLSGGTFTGGEGEESGAIRIIRSNKTLKDLLAAGEQGSGTYYAYYESGAPVTGVLDETALTQTSVTVGECTHVEAYLHNDGSMTHTLSCPACGKAETPENCTYTFDGNTGTCPDCKDTVTVTATAPGSLVYDRSPKTFTVAVRQGERTLAAGSDYTITYTGDTTNAGSVSLAVTIGQNQGAYTREFTIQPKPLTVTGITAESRAYNGTNSVKITGVTLDGVIGDDAVSIDTDGLTGTVSGTAPGEYTAVTPPALRLTGAAAGNYTLTQPAGAVSANVTISKAPALTPRDGDLAVANGRAHTYTFGLGALRPDVPDGMSLGSTAVTYELGAVSLSGGYYTGGAEIRGQTLTLPIQAVESEAAGAIGTVTVIIHTGNFADMTATIRVRSVNKIIPEGAPTLSTDTLSYGQTLSAVTLSGSMRDGGTVIPGTFAWSRPDNRPAVQEDYSAAWVFTPDDNDTYAIVNGTSQIRVVPASIEDAAVTLEPTAFRYDGTGHTPTVTGVTLGGVTLTAGTDYTAEIPTGTEAGTYTVTVTGRGNYTGAVTVTFTVNPVEAGDEFTDENGTRLRLEVETGLSTVPDALKSNPKYDTPAKIENELRLKVTEVMANAGDRIAVFDVTLKYLDGGVWKDVDPNDFPAGGVTAILPYPAGTGMTGYTFTVQHLICSGANVGTIETMPYRLTADGLECTFNSLSPVAIGYQATAQPNPEPEPEQPDEGEYTRPNRKKRTVASVPEDDAERPAATDDHAQNCPASRFPDLNISDWYHEAVDFVLARGLMSGTNTGFAPNAPLSRAMLAQILWNHAGKPQPAARSAFPDVPASEWYTGAVGWASETGVVSGYSDGRFGPDDNVTREQLAVMLWRYAGSPAASGTLDFPDAGMASAYARDALGWAVSNGILSGTGSGLLDPQGPATRAQAAQMLKNALEGNGVLRR